MKTIGAGHEEAASPNMNRPSVESQKSADASDTVAELSGSNKVVAFKIAEEARAQLLSWMKWTFGVLAVFLGILGLKGYSDYQSVLQSLREDLDGQIDNQINNNLSENYKSRTEDVLNEVINVRTESRMLLKTFADLKERSKGIDQELEGFKGRLKTLESEARIQADETKKRLITLVADLPNPDVQRAQRQKEQDFLKRSRAYAVKLGLKLPEPVIAFKETEGGVLSMLDVESGSYIVSSSGLDYPGHAEYVALMGRFLWKHRGLFEKGSASGILPTDIWQDFRYSVVDYLLETDKLSDERAAEVPYHTFYLKLKDMQQGVENNAEPVRKLAIALLESFDVNWTHENLLQKVLEVNERHNLLPMEVVRDAFATMGG